MSDSRKLDISMDDLDLTPTVPLEIFPNPVDRCFLDAEKPTSRATIPAGKIADIHDLFPATRSAETLLAHRYPEYSQQEAELHGDHPLWYTCSKPEIKSRSIASPSMFLTPASGARALVHESTANSDRLLAYLREVMGYQPDLETYTDNYRRRLSEVCGGNLVVAPAPYIPEALGFHVDYAVDPLASAHINDKDNLADIVPAEYLPRRITSIALNKHSILDAMEEYRLGFPVVIKGAGANSGGNAVKIPANFGELAVAIEELQAIGCMDVTVEEFFEHDTNHNVQLVTDGRTTEFFGYSEQVIGESGGVYGGNILNLNLARNPYSLPEPVWDACYRTAENAGKKGYHALIGLDALHNHKTNGVRLIDPNARLNGSTLALSMVPHMRDVITRRNQNVQFLRVQVRASIDRVMKHVDRDLQRGDLFVLGGASHEGESQIFVAVPGTNPERELTLAHLYKV